MPDFICHERDREDWLAARRTGLGSSDAPAILGISPFASPLSVAAVKQGLETEDHESELMRWGHYVEGPMIAAFCDETGAEAQVSGELWRSAQADTSFMLSTLDGVGKNMPGHAGKAFGIECKLKIFGADEWEHGGVPDYVLAQAQHTMSVMGWGFMVVLALLDGYRLRWKLVERDEQMLGDVLVPEERAFWEAIQDGQAIDASVGNPGATADALKRLHPDDDGTTITLRGDEWVSHFDRWRAAASLESFAKTLKERHRHALAAGMEGSTFATLDNGRTLSLKTTDRKEHAVKASRFRTLRDSTPKQKKARLAQDPDAATAVQSLLGTGKED